jgi:type I restriction enzyme S subunit
MTERYQVYDEFTSTGEVIIEDFPLHWGLTRIKFNSLVKARVGWHGLKSEDFTEEGPYLVTGSDFKGKYIRWQDCYHCDEERYQQDSYIQLKNGDLLLTKDGTIGKVALVSDLDGKATLNSGVFVVRPSKDGEFTTKYYYWLLLSRSFTDFVDFYKTGSTIVHLYQETFVNFKYALPPLAEQQKLANFLDYETAKIDTLIAKQEKLIKLLKEKRQAVISHAVTRGLNPNSPMKDSGIEWLGEVPEHWNVPKLKWITQTTSGGTPSTAKYEKYYENGSIPWIRTTDLNNGQLFDTPIYITESALNDTACSLMPNESILLAMYGGAGSIGKHSILRFESTINQAVCGIYPSSHYLPEFMHYFYEFYRPFWMINAAGTRKDPNIGQDHIKEAKVCVPPIEEQQDIVSYLDKMLTTFNNLDNKAKEAIELSKERKTALISAAVTGKIDVRNWHNND